MAFSNAQRSWTETFDCVQSLQRMLERHGHQPRVDGNVVSDAASGFSFRPLLVGFQPIHPEGARTTTTIHVQHPQVIPEAIFEFQHSNGKSMQDSIEAGFDQWCQTDLVTLLEAARPDPRDCTMMIMEIPSRDGRPSIKRRAIFGPVAHLRQQDPEPADAEEHPFCPCCLLTQSMGAFKPLFERPGSFGLRLFAMRGPDGSADADCRVNGEDFPAGKAALKQYVAKWPAAGVEFRKQYVIIQDVPADAAAHPPMS